MAKPKTAPKSKSKPKAQGTEASPAPNPGEPKTSRRMDANGLTIKQEKFCQEYVKTGNASESYRRAYSAQNMKAEVIHVKACELLKSGNVSVRVVELRAKSSKRNEITVDSLTEMLIEDREDAKASDQHSVAVAAVRELGRLHGLIIDRKDITVHGAISAMSDEELASFIDEVDVDDDDYEADASADH
jgi:phage terminase small subunit